ncbi:MAG: hypothetical protein ACOY37_00740 [Pseudomonadota bacterium]
MRQRGVFGGAGLRRLVTAAGLALVLGGCGRSQAPVDTAPVTLGDDTGPRVYRAEPQPRPQDDLATTRWPPARVGSGHARISCERDDATDEPRRLDSLEFFSLVDAMTPCQATGLLRLQYSGRVDDGFTALIERVSAMAERMDLPQRILDIDSAGGHVEEAVKAGDALAAARWTLRVREDAVCHSACVLVLAAADMRDVDGKVGVHRLMRDRSSATSRAELNEELRQVNALVREYLERHGVALAVADLMMTVPNRRLRMLSAEELETFGLQGRNAAQDDLERIVARRRCGEGFVRRRDQFQRRFEETCAADGSRWEDVVRCGIELRAAYGFPDAKCPDGTPLADAERVLDLAAARAERERAAQAASSDEGEATTGRSVSVAAP